MASAGRAGFRDAVGEARSVFRVAMTAIAEPGRILTLTPALSPPPPLTAPAAALLLTLCDFETPVWLDPVLPDIAGVADFIRFHTGALIVATPSDAAYAVISDALRMPDLAAFAQGTPEYPDRSTTLLIHVHSLRVDGWNLEGPGIRGQRRLRAEPLPRSFGDQMRANRAKFPCGIDMFLTTVAEIAALPRSIRLTETG